MCKQSKEEEEEEEEEEEIETTLSPHQWVPSGFGWRSGLHISRVAANTPNKQSRTADKLWSSSLEVGRDTNNSSP
jgi:hypothetical protein